MTILRLLFAAALTLLPAMLSADDHVRYVSKTLTEPGDPLKPLVARGLPFEPQRLADGSVFVVVPSKDYEPFALVAQIIEPDGTVIPLRAGEWLPPGFIAPGTAGQIFFGALLDDHKTLAVSFGWTNAKGRNLNGIALLERKAGDWSAKNVVVLDGTVRSIGSAPGGGFLVVNTRFTGAEEGRNWLYVTLFGTDGRIRAMFTPVPYPPIPFERDRAIDGAAQARLQRLDDNRFVFFDPKSTLATVFRITYNGPCTGTVVKRPDNFFLYPSYRVQPCATIRHDWGEGILPPAIAKRAKLQSLRLAGAHIDAKGMTRSVWLGTDATQQQPVAVVSGGIGDDWLMTGAIWHAVRFAPDGTVEALEEHADGTWYTIRAQAP